jgi:hypothetical protein
LHHLPESLLEKLLHGSKLSNGFGELSRKEFVDSHHDDAGIILLGAAPGKGQGRSFNILNGP